MFDFETEVRKWRGEVARSNTLTIDQIEELEDHVRTVYEEHLLSNFPTDVAWQRARGSLGAPEQLSAEYKKNEGGSWFSWVRVGWAAFVVSFFLPATRIYWDFTKFEMYSGVAHFFDVEARGEGIIGLHAFLIAMSGDAGAVGVLSGLTNVLMLATFFRIGRAGYGRLRIITGALVASSALNFWWLLPATSAGLLDIGYFVWTGSFALVTAGLTKRLLAMRSGRAAATWAKV